MVIDNYFAGARACHRRLEINSQCTACSSRKGCWAVIRKREVCAVESRHHNAADREPLPVSVMTSLLGVLRLPT
jgi:hypothetical protein